MLPRSSRASLALALVALAPLTLGLAATAHAQQPAYAEPLAPPANSAQATGSPDEPAIDPQRGYAVQRITGNVYFVTDGLYQAMFVVHDHGVIVVDAPPTLGRKLLAAIREVTSKPITHFIYSHSHADHVGSAHLMPDGAQYIAQRETARQLREADDPKRPKATRTFTRRLDLRVGGERLRLDYRGPNHEPGNIFIWAPRERVLMLVDVIFAGHVPFTNLAESEDIPGWIRAHRQLLDYPFRRLVGGHFGLSRREHVAQQRAYVLDLRRNARQALKDVDFAALYGEIGPTRPFELFDRYLQAAAKRCEQLTLPRWGNRLAEAAVFTDDNCFAMVESLRIDSNELGPFGDGEPTPRRSDS